MEWGGKLIVLVLMMMMNKGESVGESFRDCYVKCFVLCMIEPSQTLCSCSTTCLKSCIFPASPSSQLDDNYKFCKFGCASSLCSNISTIRHPNGDNMDNCVGSCSKRCTTTTN